MSPGLVETTGLIAIGISVDAATLTVCDFQANARLRRAFAHPVDELAERVNAASHFLPEWQVRTSSSRVTMAASHTTSPV